MIEILLVEDSPHKLQNIKQLILNNTDIKESDLHIANCVKDAKRLLYTNHYDLMILDLFLPDEPGSDADPKHGVTFLNDVHVNPMLHPPIHIIGLTGFGDKIDEFKEQFSNKLWYLINYEAESTAWQDQLKGIIFHLVKTRQRFIQESVKKNMFDYSIITALNSPELEAILKLNGGKWERLEIENDFTQYYKSEFVLGDKKRSVIAAATDQMGMTATSNLATKMILFFKPKYIIMAGIAAGIKDRELGFGDILIAEQSWDYGSGKMKEMQNDNPEEISDTIFEQDTRPIQLSADLKAKLNSFILTRQDVISKIQQDWASDSPKSKLQAKLGPLGSGSYVISSESILSDIKTQQRKLLGIDMETYGVYYAAEHSPEPKTKALSVKSVSDYGDGTKNDKYQKYAAYTSANFIFHFLMNEL